MTETRAVLYARRSYDDEQESGLETQVAALEAHAERQGYQVVDLIVDDDVSGALLFRDRPEGKKVLDLIATRAVDILLVDKVDRFGRSAVPNMALFQALPDFDVTLETLQFGKVDDSNPAAEMMLRQLSDFAEHERRVIKERTMRGKNHYIGNGSRIVSPNINLLGYTYNRRVPGAAEAPETPAHYTVNDAEATIVREVFKRFVVDGDSRRTIAQDFEKRFPGLRYWRTQTITGILTHQAYVGRFYQGRFHTWEYREKIEAQDIGSRVRGKGRQREALKPRDEWGAYVTIPPIIDETVFLLAQTRMKNEARATRGTKSPKTGQPTPPEKHSPLRGKVRCGTCGSSMWVNKTVKRTFFHCPYSSASSYYAREKGRDICKGRTMNTDKVEELVWASLQGWLDPRLPAKLKKGVRVQRRERPQDLEKEITKAQGQLDKITRAEDQARMDHHMGETDRARRDRILEHYKNRKEGQEAIIRNAGEKLHTLRRDQADLAGLADLPKLSGPEARQLLLAKAVREVVINPNKVELAGAIHEGWLKVVYGYMLPLSNKGADEGGVPGVDYDSEAAEMAKLLPTRDGEVEPQPEFEPQGAGGAVKLFPAEDGETANYYPDPDEKSGVSGVSHAMTNPLYFRIAQPV